MDYAATQHRRRLIGMSVAAIVFIAGLIIEFWSTTAGTVLTLVGLVIGVAVYLCTDRADPAARLQLGSRNGRPAPRVHSSAAVIY